MDLKSINVGQVPNDGTGTPLRTAWQYVNGNFSAIAAYLASLPVIAGPKGDPGPQGEPGQQGVQGPQGNPTLVNGKSGASITLAAADVGAVARAPDGSASVAKIALTGTGSTGDVSGMSVVPNGAGSDLLSNLLAARALHDPATNALAASEVPKAIASVIQVTPNLSDLNAAIAALASTYSAGTRSGGGDILIPAGVITGPTVTLRSGVRLKGKGKEQTILRLGNGVNADLLLGQDFYANQGHLNDNGIVDWGISNLCLDGNMANNTAGSCLAVFGYRYDLDEVKITQSAEHGMWTDGGAYAQDSMEARFTNLLLDTGGKHGWKAVGPHDSFAENISIIDFGKSADNTWSGLSIEGTMNGRFVNIHPWHRATAENRMAFAMRDMTGSNQFIACHFEGANICASFEGTRSQADACEFYACWGQYVLVIRGTENRISGLVDGTDMFAGKGRPQSKHGITLGFGSDYCANNDVSAKVRMSFGGAADFSNSQGNNDVRLSGYVDSSVSLSYGFVGVPKSTDTGRIKIVGATNNAAWSAS